MGRALPEEQHLRHLSNYVGALAQVDFEDKAIQPEMLEFHELNCAVERKIDRARLKQLKGQFETNTELKCHKGFTC